MNYPKRLLLLITIFTALRLLFSCATELGADEAYYWTYALKLQWNYFDHPPIVGWLIRLTTLNLLIHNELFVRLGAVICCGVCTWLIFKIGNVIHNERAGWFVALLYTSSIYCSIRVGANILPDSPQMIFWLAGVLILVKITRLSNCSPKSNLLWCLFGLTAGLCIMCKIHGSFLWLAALLYLLLFSRNWLKNSGIYLAAIITLVIISPIVIWNIQNNFISYQFHSSRVSPAGSGIDLLRFIKAILQQIGICNPINFFLICSSGVWLYKRKAVVDKKAIIIILCCSLPLILTVIFLSLFRETFPHWSGPAYSSLLILPAIHLASAPKNQTRIVPKVLKWALAYMVFIGSLQILSTNFFPGALSTQQEGPKLGSGDLTLDSYGWKDAGEKIDSLYRSDVAKNIMPNGAPIIITNWDSAAAIEFYVTNKTKQEVIGIGDVADLHQYYWTNKYKKQLRRGDCAYFIVPSETFYFRTSNLVYKNFAGHNNPFVFYQYRGGLPCRLISVYRMLGYLGDR